MQKVTLRYQLNAKLPFMYCQRSAFSEVNNWGPIFKKKIFFCHIRMFITYSLQFWDNQYVVWKNAEMFTGIMLIFFWKFSTIENNKSSIYSRMFWQFFKTFCIQIIEKWLQFYCSIVFSTTFYICTGRWKKMLIRIYFLKIPDNF